MSESNIKLMQHQKDGIDFIQKSGSGALFYEVGTGKTLTALSIFDKKKKEEQLRLLVICPLSLIEGAWIKEIEKFFPGMVWNDLHGGVSNRSKLEGQKADIWLINFEYLISEKKFELLKGILKNGNWMCAIDESSKMKNNRSKTVERILALRSFFKYRIIMSGTPAPNVEWEYWPQMYFIDPQILGDNFYKFKNTHFALSRGKQVMPGQFMNKASLRKMFEQGFKYEIMPDMREKMFTKMKQWCHYVRAADCLDLPDHVDEFRMIEMKEDQRKIYNQMKNQYIAEIKAFASSDNLEDGPPSLWAVANVALTKIMKLRQITSSFVIDDKGQAVAIGTNPKLSELLEIVEECGQEQMIIWCQFHWEIDQIVKALADHGVSQLHGRIPQGERIEHLDKFLSGENRFLIAHPDSAAHGLTLINCHVEVFFSLSYSLEEYNQARGRIMRKGQDRNCVYFHLICKNSIDEDMLAILQKKATAGQIAEKYLK